MRSQSKTNTIAETTCATRRATGETGSGHKDYCIAAYAHARLLAHREGPFIPWSLKSLVGFNFPSLLPLEYNIFFKMTTCWLPFSSNRESAACGKCSPFAMMQGESVTWDFECGAKEEKERSRRERRKGGKAANSHIHFERASNPFTVAVSAATASGNEMNPLRATVESPPFLCIHRVS